MVFARILEMQKTVKNTQKSDPTNKKKQKTSFQKLTKFSKKSKNYFLTNKSQKHKA